MEGEAQLLCESDIQELPSSDLDGWVKVESIEEVEEGMVEDSIELDDLEMDSGPGSFDGGGKDD